MILTERLTLIIGELSEVKTPTKDLGRVANIVAELVDIRAAIDQISAPGPNGIRVHLGTNMVISHQHEHAHGTIQVTVKRKPVDT